jgi:hypothetical protein
VRSPVAPLGDPPVRFETEAARPVPLDTIISLRARSAFDAAMIAPIADSMLSNVLHRGCSLNDH